MNNKVDARYLAQFFKTPSYRRTISSLAAGANINSVEHQRAFTLLAAQNVDIEMVIQARGHEHVHQVLEALRAQGMQAR